MLIVLIYIETTSSVVPVPDLFAWLGIVIFPVCSVDQVILLIQENLKKVWVSQVMFKLKCFKL